MAENLAPQEWTALLGAGISVDAGLPTALNFADTLIDALVRPSWAKSELKRLCRTNRPDSRDEHDDIRFETLIDWIGEVFDASLGFFCLLDDFQEPSAIHLLSASAAVSGCTLLTPNFDDLLERAITALGEQPRTIDAHSPVTGHAGVEVIKLHGTRNVHMDGIIQRSTSPLLTTVETIAAASPGTLLNSVATGVLRASIDDRTLVVSGYSASDDLDIVPALGLCRPRRVIWIDHDSGKSRSLAPRRPRNGDPAWRRLTFDWAERGARVEIRRGPSLRILSGLGWSAPSTPRARSAHMPSWQATVRTWADAVRDEDPTGLGFAGLLFANLGRYELAERAFRQSKGVNRQGAGWNTARRKYELAQAKLLQTDSQPAQAARLAAAAAREARKLGEPHFELLSGLVQARARFLLQDFEGALTRFQGLEAVADDPQERAYFQSWAGKTMVCQQDYRAALPPLNTALATLRQVGDLETCLDTLDARAEAHLGLGDFVCADRDWQEAEHIAALLGFTDRRCTVLINLGRLAFARGDVGAARTLARDAIAFAESGNDEVSLAWLLLARSEFTESKMTNARKALSQSLSTSTDITRGIVAELDSLSSHIEYLAGRTRRARHFVVSAFERPPSHSTQWARVHAKAVAYRLGMTEQDEIREALSAWRPRSMEQSIVDGVLLHSLDLGLPEMAEISARALAQAREVGARRWIEALEH